MPSIAERMQAHHQRCDEAFAEAEAAAHCRDTATCAAATRRFRGMLEAHFEVEEQILFPEFESRTGLCEGPTAVMRAEHDRMRALADDLGEAAAVGEHGNFGDCAETLLLYMQQHNAKEENILYPMCDRLFGSDAKLLDAIQQAIAASEGGR